MACETLSVLYILPVESGTKSEFGSGMAEAKKADIANKYGVICVCPTFNKAAPWYGNHATNPALRQEDFMVRSLGTVHRCDLSHPRREGRTLAGRFQQIGLGRVYLCSSGVPRSSDTPPEWDAPFMLDGSSEDWGPMGLSVNFGSKDAMLQSLPARLAAENASWLKSRPRLVLGLGIFWGRAKPRPCTLIWRRSASPCLPSGPDPPPSVGYRLVPALGR